MTILASDSGAGSDANPIGGNWATIAGLSAMRRASNSIRGSNASNDNGARWTGVTFPDDQWSAVAVGALGTGTGGPSARIASGATTLYMCDRAATNQLILYRALNGVWTQLASTTSDTYTEGDVHECRCVGTTISAWRSGVQRLSATDANIASGSAGLGAYLESTVLTNWQAGDFASGATSLPPRIHPITRLIMAGH